MAKDLESDEPSWIKALITIGVILIIMVLVQNQLTKGCCDCGDMENSCCPCINRGIVGLVTNWSGEKPSGAGSWADMCYDYQEQVNSSVWCWE